jgi:nucleotide-binding universal stress UspA family protein
MMGDDMKSKKILAALDGSPASQNALKYAVFLASKFECLLTGIYVVQEEKIGYWRFIDEHFRKELLRKGKEVLDAAEKIVNDRGMTLKTEILHGAYPYEEIVKYIEKDTDITTIVMGDHGMGLAADRRHLLGSTVERVMREIAKREIPIALTVVPYVSTDSGTCEIYAGPLCE